MHEIEKIAEGSRVEHKDIPVDVALKILQEAHQKNIEEAWAEILPILEKRKLRLEIMNQVLLMPKV